MLDDQQALLGGKFSGVGPEYGRYGDRGIPRAEGDLE
jgi:hypothetical protein